MNSAIESAFSRMSPRERNLVIGLVALMLLLVIFGGVYWVRGTLKEKEGKIERNQKAWVQIKHLAGPFLAQRAAKAATEERLKENPDAESPDSPIAKAAVGSKVRYRTGMSGEDETSQLNKILQVTGEATERPLIQRRRGQAGHQVYRVEKRFQMRRGFARTEDVFNFLADVEALDGLVFVSKLKIVRWSRDPNYIQIKNLTASTLRWEEAEN